MPDDTSLPKDDENSSGAGAASKATKIGRIAVSISIALVATSAMAQAASEEAVSIDGDDAVSEELDQAILNALGKRSVRDAVSASMDVFASRLQKDGQTLADEYFDGMDMQAWQVAQSDSTNVEGGTKARTLQSSKSKFSAGCYSNCHGACHGACHGSRGWR